MGSASGSFDKLTSTQIIAMILHELETSEPDPWIAGSTLYVPSDREIEEYVDMGAVPRMEEWKGARPHQTLRDISFYITNKDWVAGLKVLRKDLRRDKTGKIKGRIGELGGEGDRQVEELCTQAWINGATTACYDGQFFFDTDHAEGENTGQSNKIDVDISALPVQHHGSVTLPSVGEMAGAIMAGVQQLMTLKDDKNRPANGGAREFIVHAPACYTNVVAAACAAPTIEHGDINLVTRGRFKIDPVINPWLDALTASAWNDKIIVTRANGRRKPLIWQEEEAPNVDALAEGSEYEYREKAHEYSVKCTRAIGYGDYKTACQVTLI